MRTPVRILSLALLSLAAALSTGCSSNKLETGYVYTPLGSTPSQRRAYYAGPFSPEAREAMRNSDVTPADRRPRPGA
jgi:hypothetical protein